jgi:aldose 1-epimerase
MELYGHMPNGEDVFQVTIESNDLQLKVLSLGAIIQDVRMKNVTHSLVLGYPKLEPYFVNSGKLGAVVGRYANRISHGRAEIDGKTYSFNKNQNKTHTLHGGTDGSASRNWKIIEYDKSKVKLFDELPDGHMGFPGNLKVKTTYKVNKSTIDIFIEASTDKTTLCNFTNHSYFNLDGTKNIANHNLIVNCGKVLPVNKNGIPISEPVSAKELTLDFKNSRKLNNNGKPIEIDHNFCISNTRQNLRTNAIVLAQNISLELLSTEPGLQIYTGKGLNSGSDEGWGEFPYREFAGIALEPQIWPDSPNQVGFPNPYLSPHEKYKHHTRFKFSNSNNKK